MNANRIIDMIVRQVVRRLVSRGVDKGFDVADRMTRKPGQSTDAPRDPEAAKHMQHNANRQAQGMKQAQRMTRQMRRFIKF